MPLKKSQSSGPEADTLILGLEGEFKIDIEEGKHSYEFTYRLPAQ